MTTDSDAVWILVREDDDNERLVNARHARHLRFMSGKLEIHLEREIITAEGIDKKGWDVLKKKLKVIP